MAVLKALELPFDNERGDKLAVELAPETADQKKVWISIPSLTSSRSKIVIRVGLMGDGIRSRQILPAIHARLKTFQAYPISLTIRSFSDPVIWLISSTIVQMVQSLSETMFHLKESIFDRVAFGLGLRNSVYIILLKKGWDFIPAFVVYA